MNPLICVSLIVTLTLLWLEHSDVISFPEIPQIYPVLMLIIIIWSSFAPNAYFQQNNSRCLSLYFQISENGKASKETEQIYFGNALSLRIYLFRNYFTNVPKSNQNFSVNEYNVSH